MCSGLVSALSCCIKNEALHTDLIFDIIPFISDRINALYFIGQKLTIDNMFKFIQEVRGELIKVTWPTRAETIRISLIVVGISLGVGIYLGGLDFLFTEMLKFLVS